MAGIFRRLFDHAIYSRLYQSPLVLLRTKGDPNVIDAPNVNISVSSDNVPSVYGNIKVDVPAITIIIAGNAPEVIPLEVPATVIAITTNIPVVDAGSWLSTVDVASSLETTELTVSRALLSTLAIRASTEGWRQLINVTWTDPTPGLVDHYQLEWRRNTSPVFLIDNIPNPSHSFIVDVIEGDVIYVRTRGVSYVA